MAKKQYLAVVLLTLFFGGIAMASKAGKKKGGQRPAGAFFLDELNRRRQGRFGYNEPHGPSHWPDGYPECGGRAQSPLNIFLSETKPISLPENLQIPRYRWQPSEVTIVNSGHSVTLVPKKPEEHAVLRGGLLKADYQLVNVHFHCGELDVPGSEHAVDGIYSAMEMHMVFSRRPGKGRKNSYRSFDDAAVVAVFFKLDTEDNPDLEPLVKLLPEVTAVKSKLVPSIYVSIANLVPSQYSFLLYNGSLTTPPCSEVVTWIICVEPIPVSSPQIAAFRELKSPNGQLTKNRRPVQELNDRDVYRASSQRTAREFMPRHAAAHSPLLDPAILLCALVLGCSYYS